MQTSNKINKASFIINPIQNDLKSLAEDKEKLKTNPSPLNHQSASNFSGTKNSGRLEPQSPMSFKGSDNGTLMLN